MNRHTGRRLYTPPPFFVVFNWYTYFQIEYTQRPAKLPSLKFSKSNFKGENFCHMNVINMHTYVDVEIRISFSKKCVCKIACPRVIHGVRWSHTKSNLHTFHHVTVFSLMRSLDKLFFFFFFRLMVLIQFAFFLQLMNKCFCFCYYSTTLQWNTWYRQF